MVADLRTTPHGYSQETHHYLAEGEHARRYADGEVQIFADYGQRVSAATQARRQTVANPSQPVLSEELQELISRRRDRIKWGRIMANRKRRKHTIS